MSRAKGRGGRAFDKDAWLAEKAAKIEKAKELLTAGVRKLQTSDDWKAMLVRVARDARVKYRVSRYSFMNQILVMMQAPDTRATAGYRQWLGAGRQVRKGEKGIFIRQPKPFVAEVEGADGESETRRGMRFGVATVFAFEQTDGPELGEMPSIMARLDPKAAFAFGLEKLREVALAIEGQPVVSIDVRKRGKGDSKSAAGWYRPSDKTIVIIDNGNPAEMFSVLAHEVSHSLMHGAGEHHATSTMEVEAESSAFIVCHAVGLDTSKASFPYVTHWAGKDDVEKKVVESGERITRAASKIIDALYGQQVGEDAVETDAAAE